jgi:hypothetical protein
MATIITRAGKGSPLENDEVDANFTNLNDDKLEATDLSVSTGAASGGGTLSYSAGVFTFAPADLSSYITDLSSFTTTDLTEGTNLYYTNERVDDRVSTLIVPGLGITTDYDDTAGTLTIDSDTIEELCKNGTGSTILKGTPVYQTGTAGNAMIIAPADASSAATMPAVGVLSQNLAAAAEGSLILMGRISGIDTSAFSEGDVIYVASGGGYTNTRPTGESVLVQNLGRVTKVHASNGGGVVMGSGRANDVPNLTDGNIFIGNASGTYDKRAIVTADISDLTATATELNYTDGVTSNIQTQLNTKAPLASPTFTGTVTIPTADINGGTIDGTVIGGSTASAGTFTTGQFNTSLNVDGTATMDGLVSVVSSSGATTVSASLYNNGAGANTKTGIDFYAANSKYATIAGGFGAALPEVDILVGSGTQLKAATFSGGGDISFYEDTGTTPKLLWDASAEVLTSNVGGYWRLQPSGAASSPAYSFEGDADTGMYRPAGASNTVAFSTSGTERLRIDSSGNVGIGTTTPDGILKVRTGSSPNAAQILIGYNSTSENYFDANTQIFRNGSFTERMRITSTGNVGIGTSSPSSKLHVLAGNGDVAKISGATRSLYFGADSLGMMLGTGAAQTGSGFYFGEASNFIYAQTNSTERLRIDSSGNVGIGTSSPASKIHVSGSGAQEIRLTRTGGGDRSYSTSIGGSLEYNIRDETAGVNRLSISTAGNVGIGTSTIPTGVLLGRQLVASSSTGAEIIAFREDTAVDVGDIVGAFLIGNSDTDGVEDHFVGMWGKVSSTNGSQNLHFAAGRSGYEGDAPQMTIDSSGNVGIGTSSPTSELTINGGATSTDVRLQNTNSGSGAGNGLDIGLGSVGDNGYIYLYENGYFYFATNATERMRIDASGNLLVGTTTNANNARVKIAFTHPGAVGAEFFPSGTTATQIRFNNSGGTQVGSITSSGAATAYNTSSDQRLKENIADADDAGSKVDAIQVRQFDWKIDGSHQDYGMVAQELMTVAPEAVHQPEDPEDMMGVDYSKLVPMLIKEIQSLRNRVATLEGN